jgi:Fic family protein
LLHLHKLLFAHTDLIDRYRTEVAVGRHHPVLLVGLFALDLLVIHPFEDGNGRVARAVTNALIDAGYTVSRYVSLEQTIAESADDYYQALLDSTAEGLGRTAAWRRAPADERP